MKKLSKSAICTDIHFGKKLNSPVHNNDCINYLKWFVIQAQEQNCDHILFLGDWHEHRAAINVSTLNASCQGADILNSIGLPIYFSVGNHDLYLRNARDLSSVVYLAQYNNFNLINEPKIIKNIGNGILFSPFLFHDEYTSIGDTVKDAHKHSFWAGHFEFKGFVLTGQSYKLERGPDPVDFTQPKFILSGHFHKRQHQNNIHYIGNTFPMDFGDAGDSNRGMAIFDHITEDLSYIDWPDAPLYYRTTLSDLLENKVSIAPNARIQCVSDVEVEFSEVSTIKQQLAAAYGLRELTIDDKISIDGASDESVAAKVDIQGGTIDDFIVGLLNTVDVNQIDSATLVTEYNNLRVDS